MIKNYWEITLRDYDIIERTGNVSHLFRWYNILPAFLFIGRIKKTLQILSKKLNGIDTSELNNEDLWQQQSITTINAIKANYYGIVNVLKLQSKFNFIVKFYKEVSTRKLKEVKNRNLDKYIGNIKKLTGAEIKSLQDIQKVKKNLDFRIDKYNENYSVKKEQTEKVYLMSIALGIFSYLNLDFNPKITVIEFIEAKNIAEKQYQKNKSNGRN